jgi:hypothetical protein
MKAAKQKLRVLEINERFKPTPSSRNEARFQLLLVPNCTSTIFFVLVLNRFSFFKKSS